MAPIGYATLQVIPSMQGIGSKLTSQLTGPLGKSGVEAGKAAGKGIADGISGSAGAVKSASDKVAKLRDKEADAAGKVKVAEAQLQTLRDKGVTDAGRLAAAEEKVEAARRKESAATKDSQAAAEELTSAQKASAEATDDLGEKSLIAGDKLVKFGALAAAGIAAAGAGLFKLGSDFADMNNTIRIGTGATGDTLEGLNTVAKNIGTSVPASFEDIGTTVADLNTRLGLTGEPLETLASQFLELNKMGIDADINDVSQAFTGFGIKGADTSAALDELFQVSQATGLSVNDLAASAVKAGPALRQFGFGMGDSAALVGSLDKAGLDADKTLQSMSRALVEFAKDGKDPQEALYGTVTEIENLIASGEDAKALDLAGGLFGTRGAAQFVDAVSTGALSVDDFVSATGATSDTILGVADETRTFSDQWQIFTNQVLVKLEPIATRVFGVMTTAMEWLANNGVPAIASLARFMGENREAFIAVAAAISAFVLPAFALYLKAQARAAAAAVATTIGNIATAWRTVGAALKASAIAQWAMNSAILANPLTWIVVGIAAAAAGLWAFFTKTETGRKLWEKAWGAIKTAASAVWDKALKPIFDAMQTALGFVTDHWKIFAGVLAVITGPVGIAVAAIALIVTNFDKVKAALSAVGDAAMWLWNNAIVPAFNGIKSVIDLWWTGVQIYWDLLQVAWKAIETAAFWLWNNVITPVFNGIKLAVELWWAGVQVYWELLKAAWNGIATVAMWLWHSVIEPAFNGIAAAIGLMWSGVEVIFNAITTAVGWIGDKVNWLWQTVMVPAWDGIKAAISTVWDFIKPILDNIGKGIQAVGDIASKVGDAMRNAFDGVVDVLKTPIHAVGKLLASIPDSVLGIDIPGAKSIKNWGKTLQNLRVGGVVDNGLAGRTENGTLWGPGTGTSDSIIGMDQWGVPTALVSNREGVVTEEAMDNGGSTLVAALNSGWVPSADNLRAMFPELSGFATGGQVGEPYGLPTGSSIGYGSDGFPDWVTKLGVEHNVEPSTYPGHQESDRNEPGYAPNPEHLNRGIDWSGVVPDMQGFAEYLLGIAPSTDALEQIIWMNPETGQKIGWHGRTEDDGSYFASDYSGHQDHVHTRTSFSIGGPAAAAKPDHITGTPEYVPPGGLSETREFSPTSPTTPSPNTPTSTEPEKAFSGRDRFKKMFTDLGGIAADSLIETVGVGDWLDLADRYTIKSSDSAATSATPQSTTTPATVTPGSAAPIVPNPDAEIPDIPKRPSAPKSGPEMYSYEIARAAKETGLDRLAAVIGDMTALVEVGDPMKMYANNADPETLQFPHDAISSDGSSSGLFQQQNNGAWGSAADRMDPFRSAGMFFDVLKGFDYHSMDPGAAAQQVQRSAFPDKYAQMQPRADELVNQTGLFDNGGWLMPGQLSLNALNEPEPILEPSQWDTAEAAINTVKELAMSGGGSGGGDTYVTNATFRDERAYYMEKRREARLGMKRYSGGRRVR